MMVSDPVCSTFSFFSMEFWILFSITKSTKGNGRAVGYIPGHNVLTYLEN